MRWDDLQGLDFRRLRLTPTGLFGVLVRTKTSGAGRKHWELPVVIHREASLTGEDWQAAGMEIVRMAEFQFPRDYFLPVPCGLAVFGHRMASYAECSAWDRDLLHELRMPAYGAQTLRWKGLEEHRLVPVPMGLFWTEHSERHWLPSAAAAAGIAKDRRDFVGRWGLGLHQSNDYVLSSRQVVRGVQKEVLTFLFTQGLDEDEVMENYGAFVAEHGGHRGNMVKLLGFPTQQGGFGGLRKPWCGEFAPSPDKVELESVEDLTSLESADKEPSGYLFWVNIHGGSGFRRLHRTGGCHILPGRQYEPLWELRDKVADARCRYCWPEAPQLPPQEVISEDSVSSGTTSTEQPEPAEQALPLKPLLPPESTLSDEGF